MSVTQQLHPFSVELYVTCRGLWLTTCAGGGLTIPKKSLQMRGNALAYSQPQENV